MRARLVFLWILMLLAALAPLKAAQAQSSRIYFAGYMGLQMTDDGAFSETSVPQNGDFSFDNSNSFAGALGLRLTKQWRVEGELSWRNVDLDKVDFGGAGTFRMGGSIDTWTYMLNTYYDFDFEWRNIQPFVTAGVGVASHSGSLIDTSALATSAADSDVGFIWQAGAGMKYRLNDHTALTGSYRWVGASDVQFDTYEFEYGGHEIRFGMEYDIPVSTFGKPSEKSK